MASKNLTHIFMIMRDKAIQRRNVYQREEAYGDRESLIQSDNMESGFNEQQSSHMPDWASLVDDVRYNIDVVEDKTKRLSALHTNLIRRPSLDENTEEEKQLATLTSEIRMALERCQKLILQIKERRCSGREATLNKNVVRGIAHSLQEVKNQFTSTCTTYNVTMNNIKKTSSFLHEPSEYQGDYGTFEAGSNSKQAKAWTQAQLMFLEDNTLIVEERDKAVQNIFKSTIELNQLFREVAHLVQEQGTVVDQIDYNVEHTLHKVSEGAEHLKKAERHQRKNRKMVCIMVLAGAIVFFVLLIILFKS